VKVDGIGAESPIPQSRKGETLRRRSLFSISYNGVIVRLCEAIPKLLAAGHNFAAQTLAGYRFSTSHRYLLFPLLMLAFKTGGAQNYLGHNREEILLSFPHCTVADKYDKMVVLNCDGQRQVFYFQAEHELCDLYAAEMDPDRANDTLKKVEANGFKLVETKYVEPFLVSKHNNHQKFPAKVYSNGKVEYCFMPISLTGRTAELSSVIIRLPKK
jgi:hypothetical protein